MSDTPKHRSAGWSSPAPEPAECSAGEATPVQVIPVGNLPGSTQGEGTAMVRPYTLTGGRTKASYALEWETLVSSCPEALVDDAPGTIEHRAIVQACSAPQSVAEIAMELKLPLGVARVLVSDAAEAGLVTVHRTISSTGGAEAHLLLMERVLSGLHRL